MPTFKFTRRSKQRKLYSRWELMDLPKVKIQELAIKWHVRLRSKKDHKLKSKIKLIANIVKRQKLRGRIQGANLQWERMSDRRSPKRKISGRQVRFGSPVFISPYSLT